MKLLFFTQITLTFLSFFNLLVGIDDVSGKVGLASGYGFVLYKNVKLYIRKKTNLCAIFLKNNELPQTLNYDSDPLCEKLRSMMRFTWDGEDGLSWQSAINLKYENGKCISAQEQRVELVPYRMECNKNEEGDETFTVDMTSESYTEKEIVPNEQVIDEGYQLLKLLTEKHSEIEKKS